MISLADYQDGFLGTEQEGLQELQKAMVAGEITGRDTTNLPLTQEPLKVESLEKTLKLLDYRPSDIKLWGAVPKMVAYNTVEEFLQLQSYGSDANFYDEGELSDVSDSTYVRRATYVKYIQQTGEVTIQAQMVKSYVEAYGQECKNKLMNVLRSADKYLTNADSDIIPQQFDSFYKQHASIGGTPEYLYPNFEAYYNSGVVVDMRGKSIKQIDIESAAVNVDSHYGTANVLFGPTSVISTISQDYFETQRIMYGGGVNAAVTGVGVNIQEISTTMGPIKLMGDKFMKADPAHLLTDAATNAKAPAAPATVTATLAADSMCHYLTAEIGNVYYAVAAINRYGQSNLTPIGSAIAITVGDRVDLAITAGTGANAASGYYIYRTAVTTAGSSTGLTFYPLFKVSATQLTNGYNNAAAGHIGDLGYFLPNTEGAFVTQMDDEVMAIKQLAPPSKLDLAVISMSRRFIVFSFLSCVLSAPQKFVRFINVGRTHTV